MQLVRVRSTNPYDNYVQDLLRHLFVTKDYADVKFNVEGQIILAHKLVLAKMIPKYQLLVEEEPVELSDKKDDLPVIVLHQMDHEVFILLLEVIYNGLALCKNWETSGKVLELAEKLGLHFVSTSINDASVF